MPTMPIRPAFRLLTAVLGVTAATSLASAQTACGTWEPLVEDLLGDIGSVDTRVSDLAVFDAGDGPMLYMAGNFEVVVDPVFGEVRAPGLARFDGQRWSAVPGLEGSGLELDRRAIALEVFDDGSGPALFVGGEFTTAGGQAATGIARWDGTTWSGLNGPGLPGRVAIIYDIHAHDFGGGPMLYACGVVGKPDGSPPGPLWRWDSAAWSEPGDEGPFGGAMYEMASFGGDLFTAGQTQGLGIETVAGILRFDGAAWTMPLGPDQSIDLARFWPLLATELGGREVLVVGGTFMVVEGGQPIAADLAAWDGQRWDSPTAEPAASIGDATTLARFDDGSGPALFVGGVNVAGGSNIARLRDGVLTPLPPLGVEVAIELFVHDAGAGPSLLAGGGYFGGSGPATFLARWAPAAPCQADVSGDCELDVFDFLAFQNLFDAGDPAADFDGDGSLTIFDFLAFQNAFDAGCA